MSDVQIRLLDLVQRAEAAASKMSVRNPNRQLLSEMSFAVVALAQRCATLEQQAAEKPLIVTP